MRPADERFSASHMINNSIRLSLVGAQVDCSTNTSFPRTFSNTSTITSPSEKRETCAFPRRMLRWCATALARLGFALPVNTIRLSGTICICGALPAQTHWLAFIGSPNLAGEEGFEPSSAGIKIRCLNQLGDSPKLDCYLTDSYHTASGCSLNFCTTQALQPGGTLATAISARAFDCVATNAADPEPVIRATPKRPRRLIASSMVG